MARPHEWRCAPASATCCGASAGRDRNGKLDNADNADRLRGRRFLADPVATRAGCVETAAGSHAVHRMPSLGVGHGGAVAHALLIDRGFAVVEDSDWVLCWSARFEVTCL